MMLIFDTVSVKDNETVWRLPGDTNLPALRLTAKSVAASVASCLHALIQSKIFFRNMVSENRRSFNRMIHPGSKTIGRLVVTVHDGPCS